MTSFAKTLVLAAACACACSAPVPPAPRADRYRDPTAWLCLPGRAGDACDVPLDTTAVAADGTRTVVAAPADHAPVDCFYVYPTVDMSLRPGNHTDFADTAHIAMTAQAQAVRFRQVCDLYVPLYRQVTIGTYTHGGDRLRDGLDLAYSDVASAFRDYLATHDPSRPIVLLGHSQGAEMVKRLLRDFFDNDPAMRARLLVALPIGGDLEVPRGARVGGTFQHLPACSAPGETGCVIGYRSYREGADNDEPRSPLPAGHESLCVNPGDLAHPGESALLDATYPNSGRLHGAAGIATSYASYPGLYRGRCDGGALHIAEQHSPARTSPVDLDKWRFGTKLGTHVLDVQVAQDDLIAIVRRAEQH